MLPGALEIFWPSPKAGRLRYETLLRPRRRVNSELVESIFLPLKTGGGNPTLLILNQKDNHENIIGFLDHRRCHFEFSEVPENPISSTMLLGGLIFRRNFFFFFFFIITAFYSVSSTYYLIYTG